MIQSISCNIHEHSFTQAADVDQIAELLSDPAHVFWLDIESPTDQELALIAQTFHLHPLAVEDATHEHQRPKIEDYEDFFFLVFHSVVLDPTKRNLDLRELDIFVGQNYLITVHTEAVEELQEAKQRWQRNGAQTQLGIGILLYSLLDTIVDRYFPVIDALVDQAEVLEDRLFRQTKVLREGQLTLDLLSLKKHLLTFRRIATPERDVLNVLTNRDSAFFGGNIGIYFRDVYDHITRVAETLDLYRDQLSTTMDANLSVASNELNKVMRTLTATSIILMFNALVAGIYGMNFENMPELKWQFGYFGALGIMGIVTALLVLYFKRLKWF
jgi:magnesium transporter